MIRRGCKPPHFTSLLLLLVHVQVLLPLATSGHAPAHDVLNSAASRVHIAASRAHIASSRAHIATSCLTLVQQQ